MANDLNQCNFIGRLGRDPEVRYMSNGKAVCNGSIAVGSSWKDASGDKKENTEWVNFVAYDKLAEIIGQYCKKGGQVFMSGSMATRKWQDKEGIDRYTSEIRLSNMQLLGGKDGASSNATPARQERPAAKPNSQARGGFDDMADDCPF